MSLKLIRVQRLQQLQAERGGLGPAALGTLIGRKTNQTSDLLNGRAAFGEKVARSIEAAAGLPAGWLDVATAAGRLAFSRKGLGAGAPKYLSVPALTVDKSPRSAKGATLAGPLLLAPDWVQALGSGGDASRLRYLQACDDLMEPTFRDGDLLLADTAVKDCSSDGVYLLRANERLYVRRVRQRLDGQFEVTADSATVKSADVFARGQISVAGRVLWAWRGKKL